MKKRLFSILLMFVALSIVVELLLDIIWGYTAGNPIVYVLRYLIVGARSIMLGISAAVSIWSLFKHRHKLSFTIAWILLSLFSLAFKQVPMGYFETLGGLLSISLSDAGQVLDDARKLAEEYPLLTCIGNPNQRYPCNAAVQPEKLPTSFRRLHVRNVLILEDYILIEKFGLHGVFRGFVAFREGSDIWASHGAVVQQDGCSYCWRIRIIDGLYWYHAPPSDPPVFLAPPK